MYTCMKMEYIYIYIVNRGIILRITLILLYLVDPGLHHLADPLIKEIY